MCNSKYRISFSFVIRWPLTFREIFFLLRTSRHTGLQTYRILFSHDPNKFLGLFSFQTKNTNRKSGLMNNIQINSYWILCFFCKIFIRFLLGIFLWKIFISFYLSKYYYLFVKNKKISHRIIHSFIIKEQFIRST